jgi:hypothetical protein
MLSHNNSGALPDCVLRRSKRLHQASELNGGPYESGSPTLKHTANSKKQKLVNDSDGFCDSIADKENMNRHRRLAPRSRPARILTELLVDAVTDCSDFEVSDFDDAAVSFSCGILYNQREARISDVSNTLYHYAVFED